MRFLRLFGNIVLWAGALLGVVAGSVFIARKLEIINPLIVISGSMEPGIHTGDMLIDVKVKSAGLEVGDVVSLPSDLTHKLVSHRITQIEPSTDGPDGTSWKIYMQGDANQYEDIAPYYVGDEVWSPTLRIPSAGNVVAKVMQPGFSLPIVLALGALLGLSLLDEKPNDDDEFDDDARLDGDDDDRDERITVTALDEIDLALAALGVDLNAFDDTAEIDRDAFELVLSG